MFSSKMIEKFLCNDIIDNLFFYENPYQNYFTNEIISILKNLPTFSSEKTYYKTELKQGRRKFYENAFVKEIICLSKYNYKDEFILQKNIWWLNNRKEDIFNKSYSRILLNHIDFENRMRLIHFF